MFRLRRWYNQNKKTIWKVTGIVVFFIGILQLLNYFARQSNSKLEINEQYTNLTTINKQYTDLSVNTDKSVLTKQTITNSQTDSLSIINDFFKYCNEQKVNEAYNLLTEECKELMYPTLNDFRKSYYNQVFNGEKKNISIENWTGNIYKVKITNDILASGKYDESNNRQDYITIKEVDSNYKININGFIERKEINKQQMIDDIAINIVKKDVYMDYEIYTISVKNNNNCQILIDNFQDSQSMYIEDKNGIKYFPYTHELQVSELIVDAKKQKNINIKYYNKYGASKVINRIVFSRVIPDYNNYLKLKNINTYSDYKEFNIGI